MPRKKELIDKEVVKRSAGKCRFCPCSVYAALDVHRIYPGEDGGRYTQDNSVVLCAVCHRYVHAGLIKIDRYYGCTDGSRKLRIERGGQEEFV
jgi:hypothetical protein